MRFLAAVFLLLVLVQPASARARTEPEPELVEHARVRVTLIERKPGHVVGTLLEIRPEALRLERDSLVQVIARPEIRKVEMSRGMVSGSAKGLRIGAIVGGVAGVGFGLLIAAIAESETGESAYVPAGVAVGMVGALTGGGLGALVGSAFKNESWEKATLE
jgi:hypothetical protein